MKFRSSQRNSLEQTKLKLETRHVERCIAYAACSTERKNIFFRFLPNKGI